MTSFSVSFLLYFEQCKMQSNRDNLLCLWGTQTRPECLLLLEQIPAPEEQQQQQSPYFTNSNWYCSLPENMNIEQLMMTLQRRYRRARLFAVGNWVLLNKLARKSYRPEINSWRYLNMNAEIMCCFADTTGQQSAAKSATPQNSTVREHNDKGDNTKLWLFSVGMSVSS